MSYGEIPDIVVGRLPLYLRALLRLQHEGYSITSSHELGRRLGISSAQIRKDLSHFGEFGKQGTGYNIGSLTTELQRILHINREWQVALVGIGDLGRALAHYRGFTNRGFRITLLFDNDPAKINQQINSLTIQSTRNLISEIRKSGIQIAMLATPIDEAQSVANLLVDSGIKAILNYAPIALTVPETVKVQYIDPVVHLQRMAYYLK
jgi:redox-sensing transcriptional repressor